MALQHWQSQCHPAAITRWQAVDRETNSSVTGAMYTMWRNDFSKLEEFAQHAWGE